MTLTPDEIVNNLNAVNCKLKNERFREIREKARLKYDIYKPLEEDIPKYNVAKAYIEIEQCIESYKKLSKDDRILTRMYLSDEVRSYIYSFVDVAANICLNEPKQTIFTNALYMIGIKYPNIDFRDDFSEMVMICDVALRKNLSYNEYLLSGDMFAEKVKKYLLSSDIEKVLGFMRNVIKTDINGKQYYASPPWATSVQYLLRTWVGFYE